MEKLKNLKRVYIAGRITDEEPEHAKLKFLQAEATLNRKGIKTFNPYRQCPKILHRSWALCMIYDAFVLKCFCSHVLLLPNWHVSRGANIEYQLARKWNKGILFHFELSNI